MYFYTTLTPIPSLYYNLGAPRTFFVPLELFAYSQGLMYLILRTTVLRQSPLYLLFYQNPFYSYHANIVTFVALRHSVTILVTSFTAPNNLTNDHIQVFFISYNRSLVKRPIITITLTTDYLCRVFSLLKALV